MQCCGVCGITGQGSSVHLLCFLRQLQPHEAVTKELDTVHVVWIELNQFQQLLLSFFEPLESKQLLVSTI